MTDPVRKISKVIAGAVMVAKPAPAPMSLPTDTAPGRRIVRACIYGGTGTMKSGSALTLGKCGPGKVLSIGDEAYNNTILDPIRKDVIEILGLANSGAPGGDVCTQLRAVLRSLRAGPSLNWIFFDGITSLTKLVHDELLAGDERLDKRRWGTLGFRVGQVIDELARMPVPIIIYTALEEVRPHTVTVKVGDKMEEITIKVEGQPRMLGQMSLKDYTPWKVNLIGHMKPPMKTASGMVSRVNFQMESGTGYRWLAKDQLGGKLGEESANWYEIIKKAGFLPPGVK